MILCDTHCDTLYALATRPGQPTDVTMERLQKAGVSLQTLALYVGDSVVRRVAAHAADIAPKALQRLCDSDVVRAPVRPPALKKHASGRHGRRLPYDHFWMMGVPKGSGERDLAFHHVAQPVRRRDAVPAYDTDLHSSLIISFRSVVDTPLVRGRETTSLPFSAHHLNNLWKRSLVCSGPTTRGGPPSSRT